eukprot:TRINITY_DN2388_c0_g1_i2.p1 TRINITY_DN2388_c0_g1~~TRINITY_DN2388_c0_g1_i2.p1  ORF type:complete len:604 (+),score=205.42 TRINITY_DN2388_c0_g1_i2:99-1910(+)
MMRLVPASLMNAYLAAVAYSVWYVTLFLYKVLQPLKPLLRLFGKDGHVGDAPSKWAGKTILVTTGRQAKTLHTVRALKELGCRIVVTDYQEMSASAVSMACDARYTLAPLDSKSVGHWVETLEKIIVKEKVDVVLPISTINEALFIGVAKDWLAAKHPNVFFCNDGLAMMSRLDNKDLFSQMCEECGVPVPQAGIVSSREELEKEVPFGKMDIILKRIESTVNRETEIKVVLKEDGKPPAEVMPKETDPWQWQRFIKGVEYSAWFVCIEGKITFQGCYRSEGDLLYFDGIPVPKGVEEPVSKLIAKHNLTGQYAFDYFKEDSTGEYFVIECNPRSSSVLEGVSNTPGWAASFFGEDVRPKTKYQRIGFWFHLNCWPFVLDRSEGFFSFSDPLPFLVAEIAWPLELLRIKGATKGGSLPREPKGIPPGAGTPLSAMAPALFEALGLNYHHLDVNIGKCIVPGPSPGRDYHIFEAIEKDLRKSFVRGQVWGKGGVTEEKVEVLCTNPEVVEALVAEAKELPADAKRPIKITCLGESKSPKSPTTPSHVQLSMLGGCVESNLQSLADGGKSFQAVFAPQAMLKGMPKQLISNGGRLVPLEALPKEN